MESEIKKKSWKSNKTKKHTEESAEKYWGGVGGEPDDEVLSPRTSTGWAQSRTKPPDMLKLWFQGGLSVTCGSCTGVKGYTIVEENILF